MHGKTAVDIIGIHLESNIFWKQCWKLYWPLTISGCFVMFFQIPQISEMIRERLESIGFKNFTIVSGRPAIRGLSELTLIIMYR